MERIPLTRQNSRIADLKVKAFFNSVRTGNLTKLRKLVENDGINVNIKDNWDNTPLYLACLCGHPDIAGYLLEKGAHYDASSIESQRCFLSSLTQQIRDILSQYESSCYVSDQKTEEKYVNFLERLYENVPDFDVQIDVDHQIFLAHRCILAVRCQYFEDLFLNKASEQISNVEVIGLEGCKVTAEGFCGVLQFIYTGKLQVTGNLVDETCVGLSSLGFDNVAKMLETEHKKACTKADSVSPLLVNVNLQHTTFREQLGRDMRKLLVGAVPLDLQLYIPNKSQSADSKVEVVKRDYYSDVCFAVEDAIFETHKILCYGRSEYFRQMLIERQEEHPPAFEGYRPSIRLDDIDKHDFLQILSFIYTDACQITDGNWLNLLVLAEKFVLPGLKKEILGGLSNFINTNNAVHVYTKAVQMENSKLQNKCVKYIADNLSEMLSLQEFRGFLEKQSLPMRQGVEFDQIQFFEDLLYYVRNTATERQEQIDANESLQELGRFFKSIGMNITLPTVMVTSERTTFHGIPHVIKGKDDSCTIL